MPNLVQDWGTGIVTSVVNGYVCNSGCDEALARRNIDPRNPRNDPVKAEELEQKDPARLTKQAIEEATDPEKVREREEEAVLWGGTFRQGRMAHGNAPEPAAQGRFLDRYA